MDEAQQALQFLLNMALQANLPFQAHQQAQLAAQKVLAALTPKTEEIKEE